MAPQRPRRRALLALATLAACAAPGEGKKDKGKKNSTKIEVPHLRWFGIADWGGQQLPPYTTPGQVLVAQAMNLIGESHKPDFVVSAGDNFYRDGLPGAATARDTIDRFLATYQDVYSGQHLQVPWYITAGNHDWIGNVTAEIALNGSPLSDGRWTFPSLYYTFTKTIPGCDQTVQFVMIDTETLTGGVNPVPNPLPYNNLMPTQELQAQLQAQQQERPSDATVSSDPSDNIVTPGTPAAEAQSDAGGNGGNGNGGNGGNGGSGRRRRGASRRRLLYERDYREYHENSTNKTYTHTGGYDHEGNYNGTVAAPDGRGRDAVVAVHWKTNIAGGHTASTSSEEPSEWEPPPVNPQQWDWLKQTLGSSTADWIVVVGHFPVWSVGKYGPTWALVQQLFPLLQSAGVALYISGHDHEMQHISLKKYGFDTEYTVIGNGAYWLPKSQEEEHKAFCPTDSLKYVYDSGTGFAMYEVSPPTTEKESKLKISFYDYTGKEMYHHSISNPRQKGSGLATPSQMPEVEAAAAAQDGGQAQAQSALLTASDSAAAATAAEAASNEGGSAAGPAQAPASAQGPSPAASASPAPGALAQALHGDFFEVQSRSGDGISRVHELATLLAVLLVVYLLSMGSASLVLRKVSNVWGNLKTAERLQQSQRAGYQSI